MGKIKFGVAIDTTSHYLGLSLFSFGGDWNQTKELKSFFKKKPQQQSELIIPELTRLFKKAKVKKNQIELVCVNNGPGSFTGVRVGVAVARTLGQGLNVPTVDVNALEATAFQFGMKKNKIIVVKQPALPGEMYGAEYKARFGNARQFPLKIITKPFWQSEKEGEIKSKTSSILNQGRIVPHPFTIGRLGVCKYNLMGRRFYHYAKLHPLYLQPSWAERKK